jgi:hypothetical protein
MIYTIYGGSNRAVPPGESRFDGLVAIPECLAFWGLVCPPLWLVVHKLWLALAFYGLMVLLALGLLVTPYQVISPVIIFVAGLYIFLEGHQLRRRRLEHTGQNLIGLVDASNETSAIGHFLDKWNVEPDRQNPLRMSPVKNQLLPSTVDKAGAAFGLFPAEE